MSYKYYELRRNDSNCHIFEFDPNEFRLDVTIGTFAKLEKLSKINGEPKSDEKVIAKINGGFFDMGGSTEYLGTFVDEGLYYSGSIPYYPTLIYWKNTNRLTFEFDVAQSRCAQYQQDAYFAIGVPWTLVINGEANYTYDKATLTKVFSHPYYRAPRTLIGQKSDGTIVWAVIDGRSTASSGFTIIHSSDLMLELGCIIAANLDGGGSSEMIVNGEIKNVPSDGAERSIGTAFMCYGKDEIEETPYEALGKVINVASDDTLNVRRGPSTSYNKIVSLKNNTPVKISAYNSTGKWCKISASVDNVEYTGWVNKYYIEEIYGSIIEDNTPFIIIKEGIAKDTSFKLLDESDHCYKISYNGETVWVKKEDLKI